MGPPYGKLPILFPYHSHIFRDSYGSSMGMGVPLLGVPRISLDIGIRNLSQTVGPRSSYKWRDMGPLSVGFFSPQANPVIFGH